MTFTYSPDLALEVHQVRFYVQDTVEDTARLQDEEIDFLLTEEGSVIGAALIAAETIVAQYASLADASVGDLSISYSQKYQQYLAIVNRLRRKLALGAVPFVGGQSVSRKQSVREDTDIVAPAFEVEMMSHPDSDADLDRAS